MEMQKNNSADSDDECPAGRSDPDDWFESWLQNRGHRGVRMADSSVAIYRARWNRFTRFLTASGSLIETVDKPAIEAFWTFKEPTRRNFHSPNTEAKIRYLRMLGEIFELVIQSKRRLDNPALAELRGLPKNTRMRDLNVIDWSRRNNDIDSLINYLGPISNEANWQEARNWTITNLALGAGLKAGEIRDLRFNQLESRFHESCGEYIAGIQVNASSGRNRYVSIAKIAADALLYWKKVHFLNPTPDALLFTALPSPRDSIPEPLSSTTIYRVVNGYLKAHLKSGGGPQSLRNACLARLFECAVKDRDISSLANWMGLEDIGRLRTIRDKIQKAKRIDWGLPEPPRDSWRLFGLSQAGVSA